MLTQYIGDSKTHVIPLTWDDAPFEPGEEWVLIFTAKRNLSDPDSDAVFQKASGAGITVDGSEASVATVPQDSAALDEAVSLVCGVRAININTEERRTVFVGRLPFKQRPTREDQTSVPVFTTEEPLPFAPLINAENICAALGIDAYADLATANAALARGVPFYNLSTLKLDITTA